MRGVNLIRIHGFTLIEAIISLSLFAIAFSGLYFFFGMAQQANNNTEKKMYLNLMANQILETITAESYRNDTDIANPFNTPASYNADLSDCSLYTAPDVRHIWCTELDASVGPHKGVHVDEVRTVEVVKDEKNLIVNVTLVADGGIGNTNLIKTFFSRKIVPPRRPDQTPLACIERHNTLVNFIKKHKADCESGAQGQFSTYLYQSFWAGWPKREKKQVTWRTQCMYGRGYHPMVGWSYNLYYSGLSSGVGFTSRMDGYMYSVGTMFSWGGGLLYGGWQCPACLARQFNEYLKWQINDDISTPGTIYGAEYNWHPTVYDYFYTAERASQIFATNYYMERYGASPGTIQVTHDINHTGYSWAELVAAQSKIKAKTDPKPNMATATVVSCCPTEKLSDGTYKPCGLDHRSRADRVPFLAETITF